MKYHQLTSEERYTLSVLRKQGHSQASIAREMGRHPSTISRELRRNRHQGSYKPTVAIEKTNGRRRRSRRTTRFDDSVFVLVGVLLKAGWSPEQISGRLRREGRLRISHETIYRHVLEDKRGGGSLYKCLRCSQKKRRKRYGAYDSRGRLAGKRHISERPSSVDLRLRCGHWEIDTVMGGADQHCILTIVERKSGFTLIGKLEARNQEVTARRAIRLIRRYLRKFSTVTADNGTEFHSHEEIERKTGVKFFFATPYHSWERGTNENTNGLIRQYLPKRHSMRKLTQQGCNAIADKLNDRPRKRHGYRTPREVLLGY